MSTRCNIIVREINDNDKYSCTEHYIYHYYDGYPDGVGSELREILKSCPSYDWETVMEKILKYDCSYEEVSKIYRNEEYIYEIDTNGNCAILKCYYSTETGKDLLFKETYPEIMRSDLDKKFKELRYKTENEKYAFLDGVMWIECFPTEFIIKRVLTEALNTIPDLSNDLDSWIKVIKERLSNEGG